MVPLPFILITLWLSLKLKQDHEKCRRPSRVVTLSVVDDIESVLTVEPNRSPLTDTNKNYSFVSTSYFKIRFTHQIMNAIRQKAL